MARLQRRRLRDPPADSLTFLEPFGVDPQVGRVGGCRSAQIVRRGRAGIGNADPPVVAGGRESERVNAAGERLALAAELSVDAAQALLVEKDTGVIPRARVQAVALVPPAADADEKRDVADGRVVFPALAEDPLPLRFRDVDFVLTATFAAAVAVPLLDDGQVPNRPAHDAIPHASAPPSRRLRERRGRIRPPSQPPTMPSNSAWPAW